MKKEFDTFREMLSSVIENRGEFNRKVLVGAGKLLKMVLSRAETAAEKEAEANFDRLADEIFQMTIVMKKIYWLERKIEENESGVRSYFFFTRDEQQQVLDFFTRWENMVKEFSDIPF